MGLYSQGEWYRGVPRGRLENLRFRRWVSSRAEANPKYREALRRACAEDILFFVNVFVWQFNPNAIGEGSSKVGPFVTWDFQDDAIREVLRCIEERSDLVIEKSRDMGASWMCLIIMLWFLLFKGNSKFLCVSRNTDAVDEPDDSDSLFWKLDFMLRHIPEWIVRPSDVSRKVLSFSNRVNGSMITGQASTGKAGVGGRALAMFIDEFSQIREDWEILERTSDTTGCRIFNGTHRGTNTAFYELTTKAVSAKHLRKIVMHWSQHPDKRRGLYRVDRETGKPVYLDPEFVYSPQFRPVCDGTPSGGPFPGLRSPWYDRECERKASSRGVAADLDINPTGSVEQVFNALLIADLKKRYCREPDVEADMEWQRLSAEPERLHREKGGKIKLWIDLPPSGIPRSGLYCFGADCSQGTGATPSCLAGYRVDTGEKVLEYTNPLIEPKDFAYFAVAICRLFARDDGKGAKLIWEVGGPGSVFTKHVQALNYNNIWYRPSGMTKFDLPSSNPGWANNPESMKLLIEDYKDALRSKQILNFSEFALSECLAFVYGPDGYVSHMGWKDPKDPSGARVNHGDRVIADALCWRIIDQSGMMEQFDLVDGERTFETHTLRSGTLAWRQAIARMSNAEGNLA